MNTPSSVTLVYRSEEGTLFEQPLTDITSAGTLIDPETGDDLELVGWRFADTLSLGEPDAGSISEQIDAVIMFAGRGVNHELGAMDPRHPYTEAELREAKTRFANSRAGIALLRELTNREP